MDIRIFFKTIFAIIIFSHAASAQETSEDPFCAYAPIELLAALDGSWTLSQGAGVAFAATLTIPLPPHAGQAFKFEYDPERYVAILSGGTPHDEMAMIPVETEAIVDAMNLMLEGQSLDQLDSGEGCDFYSIPLVIGSNIYDLSQAATESGYRFGFYETSPAHGVSAPIMTGCVSREAYESLERLYEGGENLERTGDVTRHRSNMRESGITALFHDRNAEIAAVLSDDRGGPCSVIEISPPGSGEMVMSISIRFQSVDRGTGMVRFSGSRDGYPFAAVAPITLTR